MAGLVIIYRLRHAFTHQPDFPLIHTPQVLSTPIDINTFSQAWTTLILFYMFVIVGLRLLVILYLMLLVTVDFGLFDIIDLHPTHSSTYYVVGYSIRFAVHYVIL